ncbi:Phosphoenolpyruvate-protein phosphotransferase [Posidoniimonas corsicana]|uniref:Phosphoenolpyruvate-protein phosphotransferase n=1 Tax=Posidoniimonas corsicana TaxID=1938618 RepID=A0A5C5V6J1_9BACT|nr:phosphoenolpyruvate--protein phosphotransferase [Posidoniimonas corsicana]TWT33871.1 Phosphoenolpyruvate-protein phosphotransferase [Posidoniimonas corsicana]
MPILEGTPVSPGLASGTAIVYDFEVGRRLCVQHAGESGCDVTEEWERVDSALAQSSHDLGRVAELAGNAPVSATSLSLLSAHAAMTAEIAFLVKKHIDHQQVNADRALESVIAAWVERLTRLDSEYLREREQDVRDVGRRMARYLSGSMPWSKGPLKADSIVVARELLPSEAVELSNCGVLAIVADRGGRYGHTAILARSLNIPMVSGITDAARVIHPGDRLLVDGETGLVVVNPTANERGVFNERMTRVAVDSSTKMIECGQPCTTLDGVGIELVANLGRPDETASVVEQGLEGVGLFRTEFMFIDAPDRPDPATQGAIYADIANQLAGRPLVVRTFDLGRDKIPPFLLSDEAEQPNGLHLGGLRFLLAESSLFESQLQAILEVSQDHDLRILLPMVVGSDDFGKAVSVIQRVADRCGVLRTPPIGAMIETPAALFCLDQILDQADFVALGTNDLTQLLLATDRDLAQAKDDCTAMHPSVLRAIKSVVGAAARLQCPLCVCGEEAGDPDFACLLVGLGIRELSLGPTLAPAVRSAIRKIDSGVASRVASRAIDCDSVAEVRELIDEWRSRDFAEADFADRPFDTALRRD